MATALFLARPAGAQDTTQRRAEMQPSRTAGANQAGESLEQLIRDLHKKVDTLAAKLEATRAELERCLPRRCEELGEIVPPTLPPTVDPQALYNAAYNDYLKGHYDLAVREFEEYVANFPASELAGSAHYWIGESHYRQRHYRQAIEKFDALLKKYPRSDKVAAALLKKGYAQLELGERSQGIAQLRVLIRKYPTSDEASLARQRLRELGVDAG